MNDEKTTELMAAACHTANRAYCLGVGDLSQVPWEQAPQWQKDSAIIGVVGVLEGNGPEDAHKSWLKQKEADGWVYGEVKDPEKKTHPCMVPYSDLPTFQKTKDHIFVDTVKTMKAILEQ